MSVYVGFYSDGHDHGRLEVIAACEELAVVHSAIEHRISEDGGVYDYDRYFIWEMDGVNVTREICEPGWFRE